MRLIRAALLLAGTCLPLAAQAQSAPASTLAVTPIAYTSRTLANGLRVYAIPDKGTSNVAIQVWYDVGGKDDPAGRSGFAHLFEHLMFKASRNLVPEQFDRLTEDVGGFNNASTDDDYTDYYEVVPANHLQRLLFAEADRMASLVVEPTSFASERDVVKEEYRLRVLAQPYGKLYGSYLPALGYTVHPYARGVIGNIANLDSATIDDVRAFHATYYRPDNAVLVVAGNFDPNQLDAWVDQYFAPIKRPTTPIPRVTVHEPVRDRPVSRTVYEPGTPLPAVMISYPIPPDNTPDIPALTVLEDVLATGNSSRLYDSLVYRQALAQDVGANLDSRQQEGLFVLSATMASGKDAAAGEAALRQEAARLRDTAITPAELAEAKNEILTAALKQRETAEGKARVIASSVIVDGDPGASDRQLDAIARVTAADVQRVARTYLADNRSATIRYLPVEAKPAGVASQPITPAASVRTRVLTTPADLAIVTPAPASERIAPPAPGTPVNPAVPRPVVATLANGLTVVTIENHELPLVTANLVARGGGMLDLGHAAGTASLSADLLAKGTATSSATQIAAAAEALGSSLDTGADRDSAHAFMTVRTGSIAPALAIIGDVAQHPAFAPDELERARAQAIDAVQVSLKSPGRLAGLIANRAVFGDGLYGGVLGGTPASLKSITRADVTRAYRDTWRPEQTILVLAGDITPARARAEAERVFGGWHTPGLKAPLAPAPVSYAAPRTIVVDLPDAGQAAVAVARPAIARGDPAYHAAELANAVLGGGFSSRLNAEIRIKRGLSYGASSSLSARREGGLVAAVVQTKNPSAPQVAELIRTEMTRLGHDAVPLTELDARKAALIGDFGREAETTEGLAGLVGGYLVEDVPLAELQSYAAQVQALSPAQVQAAAARLLDPRAASVIVVGDAKQFASGLRAAYPRLDLIPMAQLDLDRPALR
jgi:zinc protease